MNIRVEKHGDYWTADIKDLTGAPPVGIAKTEVNAVIALFIRLENYIPYKELDKSQIFVNGKLWE